MGLFGRKKDQDDDISAPRKTKMTGGSYSTQDFDQDNTKRKKISFSRGDKEKKTREKKVREKKEKGESGALFSLKNLCILLAVLVALSWGISFFSEGKKVELSSDFGFFRSLTDGFTYSSNKKSDSSKKESSKKESSKKSSKKESSKKETSSSKKESSNKESSKKETSSGKKDSSEKTSSAKDDSAVETAKDDTFDVTVKELIDKQYLSISDYTRPGIKLSKVNNIVIHSVGKAGVTAKEERDYYESLAKEASMKSGVHFIVDIDGSIIQCVPSGEMTYATNSRNSDTISVEFCYSEEDGRMSEKTYNSMVKLIKYLMEQKGLKSSALIRHYDATGKLCPAYYVNHEEAWKAFVNECN